MIILSWLVTNLLFRWADFNRINIERSERFLQLEQSTQTVVQALTPPPATGGNELSQLQDFQDQTVAIALLDRGQGHERSVATRLKVDNELLQLLSFPVMADRYNNIQDAHAKTFDWIFNSKSFNDRGEFPDWLSHGSGIDWINGKPASGRSTIMKYIFQDPRTRMLQQHWAGSQTLVHAAFFFWNSGSAFYRW